MTIYVPGKVTLRQTWQPMDPDAAAYITAVETADGQALEEKVKIAIDNFVLGCKADGIWSAIKASCILAGARTLAGALVPLVGTAPTNYNFVVGDYNRETGLKGNGSNKYLDSNRANDADPQNSQHLAVWASESLEAKHYIGVDYRITGASNISTLKFRSRDIINPVSTVTPEVNFNGVSRGNSSSYFVRVLGINYTYSAVSSAPTDASITVFGQDPLILTPSRLAFYSIGESLDLALLDTRVTTLMSDLAAAIP